MISRKPNLAVSRGVLLRGIGPILLGCACIVGGCASLASSQSIIAPTQVEIDQAGAALYAKIWARAAVYAKGPESAENIGWAVVGDCIPEIQHVLDLLEESFRADLPYGYDPAYATQWRLSKADSFREAMWRAAVAATVKARSEEDVR